MALIDLFKTNFNDIPSNLLDEIEKAGTASKYVPSGSPANGGFFSRLKNALSSSKAPGLVNNSSGATVSQYFDFLGGAFGDLENPGLSHTEMLGHHMNFEAALQQHSSNIPFDKSRLKTLGTQYDAQKKLIGQMETTLSEARYAATHAVPQMIDAFKSETQALQKSLDKLSGKTFATLADAQKHMGAQGGLLEEVQHNGKNWLAMSVTDVANPSTTKPLLLSEIGSKIEAGAVGSAKREVAVVGAQLIKKPSEFLTVANNGVKAMEQELAKSKTMLDDVGMKVLGKGSAFAGVEKSALAAAGEKSGLKGLKFIDKVKANAFEGGMGGKAKVGFGAAFTLDGLRRIKNAFVPGNGPDGQPQPMDLTQAVIGTVEGAGGLFLAQHGHGKA